MNSTLKKILCPKWFIDLFTLFKKVYTNSKTTEKKMLEADPKFQE